MESSINIKQFAIVTLLVSIWVNASEVFRYFIIVMPKTRIYLAAISEVAPMDWGVFAIWGIWDTILTALIVFVFWIVSQNFGNNTRSILIAGTLCWALFFLLFWVGMVNMNLAQWSLALIALPLAFLETVVASFIASRLFARS
ncbi:MAG: hypothetical protein AAF704_10490 [Cyanobacteria bacterium P01_D01_bin.123]